MLQRPRVIVQPSRQDGAAGYERTRARHRDGTGPQQICHQTHPGRRGRGQHVALDTEEPQQEADAKAQVSIARQS